jgi:hypothetical protein
LSDFESKKRQIRQVHLYSKIFEEKFGKTYPVRNYKHVKNRGYLDKPKPSPSDV